MKSKRIGIIFLSIVFLVLFAINGYKFMLWLQFKNHLQEAYPNEKFKVNWVKYDFIYLSGFYAEAEEIKAGTGFGVSIHADDGIRDGYIRSRNLDALQQTLKNSIEPEANYIKYFRHVSGGTGKYELIEKNVRIDYKDVIDNVYFTFKDNSITDMEEMAEAMEGMVKVLLQKGFKPKEISFTAELNGGVYEARLVEEEIHYSQGAILSLIRRVK